MGVQNETAFYKLFQLLASQTGNLINVNKLSSSLQIKNETVDNYLTILRKCFQISLINPYFNNLRKELTKMQKGGDGHYKDSLLVRMPFTIMQCSILTVKTDRYFERGEKSLLVAP